jgi:hydrogenase-4 component B
MALYWVLAAAACAGVSGVPAVFAGRKQGLGQACSATLMVAASVSGLAAAGWILAGGSALSWSGVWSVPGGSFAMGMDVLSAWFLVPVFLIPGLGAIFGLQYWPQSTHPTTARKVQFFYGVLTGGMVLLVVARNSVLFLLGWELMAVAAFFLVSTEDAVAEVRSAAWAYLVATHVGTAALMAMFALMWQAAGSFDWAPLVPGSMAGWPAALTFLLALLGFGLKAGIMPLHVWLPPAHSNAPSHVSAVMSGVMIKMGIYGLVRVCTLLPSPPLWWGVLLMAVGGTSGVIAAAAAVAQHDLKRMLAYSSIENVGLITMGLGLALAGLTARHPTWVMLGLGAAMLHGLNHSLFKSLLFLGSGSILHSLSTRRMDLMGGLAAAMPLTAIAFLIGTLSVSAVPGFNGLPGEFALYLGLFNAVTSDLPAVALVAMGCIAAVALTGALALASFVRAFGVMFLGVARSPAAGTAHEPRGSMTAILLVLSGLCVAAGVLPFFFAPALERLIGEWSGHGIGTVPLLELVPLGPLAAIAVALWLPAGIGIFWLNRHAGRSLEPGPVVGTWDCGYADPSSARIQYTSSSFAALLAGLFAWAVSSHRPQWTLPGTFPAPWGFATSPIDRLLTNVVIPFCQRMAERFSRVRVLQQGMLHYYLVYILATLMVGIAWAALSPWSPG